MIVAWKGPFSHVRYSVGTPGKRGFTWTPSDWLSSAPVTETSAAPALAEVRTGTAKGTLYVFWKDVKNNRVHYATTSDPLNFGGSSHLTWSSAKVVSGAATNAGPAASALGSHGFGPLLVAYKVPGALNVRFQTLTGSVSSLSAIVPGASTAVGPSLLSNRLATTSSDTSGSIVFRFYS